MVNKGPELLKCAEDDDFLAEFDKMITEVGYYGNLFLKMVITRKIFVGVSSNFLHSIRTSICIKNVIKIGGDFGVNFWKKPWTIVFAFFQKLAVF